ncbi:Uncharacterised protein [Staphylococcus gallinarum]|jgi:hypothetical protein|nr:Uncharacterised protein [Staphylococcus gallinarum]
MKVMKKKNQQYNIKDDYMDSREELEIHALRIQELEQNQAKGKIFYVIPLFALSTAAIVIAVYSYLKHKA